MSHRRNLGRAPTDRPVMVDETTNQDWTRWFSQIAEYVFKWEKYDVTVDVTSVAANTTSEQSVTVTGVASNDFVMVSKPSHSTGLGIANVRVSAQDTVNITFINTTGSAIDPGSETYTFLVLKV